LDLWTRWRYRGLAAPPCPVCNTSLVQINFDSTAGQFVLDPEGLCSGCKETRKWSRANKAYCDFIHRGVLCPR